MVLNQRNNDFGVKYEGFVAAEQEYNTNTYGIKGNIDGTILLTHGLAKTKKLTALEIKTGKHKKNAYRGQVILYSLLISERFCYSNPENILIYIRDEDLKQGFEMIKQQKLELDSLIMTRNELARWHKKNQFKHDAG